MNRDKLFLEICYRFKTCITTINAIDNNHDIREELKEINILLDTMRDGCIMNVQKGGKKCTMIL